MRYIVTLCLCLAWISSQAQTVSSKIAVNTIFMPRFTVREASDSNVRATGIRWTLSDYGRMPLDIGLHAYAGYGDVAGASFGLSLAYVFARPSSFDFKIGLSMSEITLKDVNVEAPKAEFGPHVGDVNFSDFGTEFKPYLEWEWNFSHFSSLFVHTGYRVINGERTLVTAVEGEGLDAHTTDRDDNFFYSASGFEFGVGISVNFYYHGK